MTSTFYNPENDKFNQNVEKVNKNHTSTKTLKLFDKTYSITKEKNPS